MAAVLSRFGSSVPDWAGRRCLTPRSVCVSPGGAAQRTGREALVRPATVRRLPPGRRWSGQSPQLEPWRRPCQLHAGPWGCESRSAVRGRCRRGAPAPSSLTCEPSAHRQPGLSHPRSLSCRWRGVGRLTGKFEGLSPVLPRRGTALEGQAAYRKALRSGAALRGPDLCASTAPGPVTPPRSIGRRPVTPAGSRASGCWWPGPGRRRRWRSPCSCWR